MKYILKGGTVVGSSVSCEADLLIDGEKIAAVRAVHDSLAVRQTAERVVASYFDEARQVLRSLRLSEERLAPLRELSDMLLNRRK